VSITSTNIWARSVITPASRISPNIAAFGGGIFNGDMGAHATATLGSGALVAGNLALVDGGGVFNADGASLVLAGGIVRLNRPDDIVDDPNFF
jgi:hypothetical protein